jgi:hypothetical protein
MITKPQLKKLIARPRAVTVAEQGDAALGPLKLLPGTWEGSGTGWNMIALPFDTTIAPPLDYRLLLNQYSETLNFSLVDKAVPNRGLNDAHDQQTDQHVVTLDYEQVIAQDAVIDEPQSAVAGDPGAAIHHEPGLFLHMLDRITDDGFDIARLATIPHGDAALALGKSRPITDFDATRSIPAVNGLPVGVRQDLSLGYLAPYKKFEDAPFMGNVVGVPGFPGFKPSAPHLLLIEAAKNLSIKSTMILELDTTNETGGIHNIPFVVKQANAASMKSTFWIHELDDDTLVLQYLQVVMLDFFPRRDGQPGRISWPHVSINTLTKVSTEPASPAAMTTAPPA